MNVGCGSETHPQELLTGAAQRGEAGHALLLSCFFLQARKVEFLGGKWQSLSQPSCPEPSFWPETSPFLTVHDLPSKRRLPPPTRRWGRKDTPGGRESCRQRCDCGGALVMEAQFLERTESRGGQIKAPPRCPHPSNRRPCDPTRPCHWGVGGSESEKQRSE